MNTSYATAGDPAGRGMPSTRQSADIGGAEGEAGPAGAPTPEMPVHASHGNQEPQKGGVRWIPSMPAA